MKKHLPTITCAGFTVCYLMLVAWIGWPKLSPTEVRKLDANEIGDVLAGVFGPIALGWLIAGYLRQGREIKENGEAIAEQSKLLTESIMEQKRLANAASDQVKLTLEALTHEWKKTKAANHPSFGFSRADSVPSHGTEFDDITLEFTIVENPAFDLTIATDQFSDRIVEFPGTNVIKSTPRISFQVPRGLPVELLTVTFTCKDRMGEPIRQQTKFRKSKWGDFHPFNSLSSDVVFGSNGDEIIF